MKNLVRITTHVAIIVFVGFYFYVAGCQKNPQRGEKAGVVEGFVRDSQSLIPIVGADVFLDDDPYDPRPKTDSTGYYRVVTTLADWKLVKISIKAQGYTTENKSVILRPKQTQGLQFFLVKE